MAFSLIGGVESITNVTDKSTNDAINLFNQMPSFGQSNIKQYVDKNGDLKDISDTSSESTLDGGGDSNDEEEKFNAELLGVYSDNSSTNTDTSSESNNVDVDNTFGCDHNDNCDYDDSNYSYIQGGNEKEESFQLVSTENGKKYNIEKIVNDDVKDNVEIHNVKITGESEDKTTKFELYESVIKSLEVDKNMIKGGSSSIRTNNKNDNY